MLDRRHPEFPTRPHTPLPPDHAWAIIGSSPVLLFEPPATSLSRVRPLDLARICPRTPSQSRIFVTTSQPRARSTNCSGSQMVNYACRLLRWPLCRPRPIVGMARAGQTPKLFSHSYHNARLPTHFPFALRHQPDQYHRVNTRSFSTMGIGFPSTISGNAPLFDKYTTPRAIRAQCKKTQWYVQSMFPCIVFSMSRRSWSP